MNRFVPTGALFASVLSFAVVSLPQVGSAQGHEIAHEDVDHPGHFRVFTGAGEPATLDDIVQAMSRVDAVLVGEIHTDPIGHWIEAELFRQAVALTGAGSESGARRSLALSLEMFERDVQGVVDEYLADLITESQFKASARPWEYYDADYRDMVETAKSAGVPVLAANAPRRYVNRVSRMGPQALQDLPAQARSNLPPLPFPAPTQAYRDEWNLLMGNMTMESQCPAPEEEKVEAPPAHTPPPDTPLAGMPTVDAPAVDAPAGMPSHGGSFIENGLQAQTLWDASMANTITTFLDAHPGALVLHMVGGFHVQNFTGTPEKVEFYRPGTRRLVIHMDVAEDFETFVQEEHAGRGDFVILTDESLDLYYQRNCVDQGSGDR